MSEIPEAVKRLCLFDSPITNVEASNHHCYVTTMGLELRFVRTVDDEWEWDEVVGPCRVHVEQMDTNYYLDRLRHSRGQSVCGHRSEARRRADDRLD